MLEAKRACQAIRPIYHKWHFAWQNHALTNISKWIATLLSVRSDAAVAKRVRRTKTDDETRVIGAWKRVRLATHPVIKSHKCLGPPAIYITCLESCYGIRETRDESRKSSRALCNFPKCCVARWYFTAWRGPLLSLLCFDGEILHQYVLTTISLLGNR